MTGKPKDIKRLAGRAAVEENGWWTAHKWLVWRRVSQASMLLIFLVGPLTGFWLIKGTLISSLILDSVPLADPLVTLQAFVAGHSLEIDALIGTAIVLAVYAVIGGRMYCSWVCPVNVLSDGAHWLRVRLNWTRSGVHVGRGARLWILGGVLLVSAFGGVIAWEAVNPISIIHRGLVYGTLFTGGLAWMVVAGIFLVELVGGNRVWCSHLCPVGAFYGLIGNKSFLRVSAPRRDACDDCLDCFAVCPEGQVITPALKGAKTGDGPVILSSDCTNCGRCIDVCPQKIFEFSNRFKNRPEDLVSVESPPPAKEAA
ncbi:quinol dehydrogenase ferredoxin subunit NapH [Magnetospira sp. QH-2]|uniref:quinol dehydrogenase ferredoxin subunit NapH n=1 Tax=Magnetospira sp. (strain QH-2) TaxID=1288970 RepID=UPI0003E80B75|nr:quinol dehydrogenase ferredoxin subunit NapH [Magnetospira sp. QH-2]CCQ73124.1 Ferredoxin-type protein NapH [Magnetospira sp. QH-2]